MMNYNGLQDGNTGGGTGSRKQPMLPANTFVKPISVKLLSHHRETIGCHMDEDFCGGRNEA